MADNVAVTPGTGATIAADDIGAGVLVQRVKTTWGPDGTANDTDVATGKPLPVQVRTATGLIPIGEPTDAKNTATDTTSVSAVSIWKQISASVQAIASSIAGTLTVATHAVTQSGTWSNRLTDGTNTAAVKAASTAAQATDPALVVAISPNSVNANGGTTAANSAPVVNADQYGAYETVAASQTAQALGATGATGDYLAGVLVFPGTAGCGVVTILDNATTIGTFAGGGTTALPSLVPFMIPVGLFSVSGAWKITTGANVTAVGVGKFT